jgi:NAD(P)H-quinone oxidoreductase subunit 4
VPSLVAKAAADKTLSLRAPAIEPSKL